MLRAVVVLTLLAVSMPAAAGPTDGAEHCAALDARLDAIASDTWYEFCGGVMSGEADARVYYSQTDLGCTFDPTRCDYLPTMHVALDTLAPGEWVLRGTSRITNYPSGSYYSGSTRSVECRLSGPDASCDAPIDNRQITSTSFASFRFDATWSLFLVDPTGAEHLQATGANEGWLAQYHQG